MSTFISLTHAKHFFKNSKVSCNNHFDPISILMHQTDSLEHLFLAWHLWQAGNRAIFHNSPINISLIKHQAKVQFLTYKDH